MHNITLIIPAKYERDSLPVVLDEILKISLGCKLKICLSKDDLETLDAIKKYPGEVLFQKNLGYGAAITEGIENNTNEFFCIFNNNAFFIFIIWNNNVLLWFMAFWKRSSRL